MTNYAQYPDCQCGTSWFPDRDSALPLISELASWGMILDASEGYDIAAIWPVVCGVFISPTVRAAIEVFDVTAGFPALDNLDVATYYPTATLFQSAAAYGWSGSFSTTNLYSYVDNASLTAALWPTNNRPMADSTFVAAGFLAPYEVAFQFGSVAGTLAGKAIANLNLRWRAQRLSEDANVNAITIRPYIQIDGERFIGEWQSLSTDEAVEFTTTWYVNPTTGRPWTAADVDEFDDGSGSTYGFGFLVDGTGSANTLAMLQQVAFDVEYADTEVREVIGSLEVNQTSPQGWHRATFADPDTGAAANLTLTPGNKYLIAFRKVFGHGMALCRIDQPDTPLDFAPKWTSADLTVDAASHRIIAMGDEDSVIMGLALEKDTGDYSLDSQVYATTSPEGLDTPDDWPKIGAYFRMSPIDATHQMFQRFTPTVTDQYPWLRMNLAAAAGTVDADLYFVVRDAATNTNQHTPQRISVDDLQDARVAAGENRDLSLSKWQDIGLLLDDPPTLTAGTQYVFAVYSVASHRQGWLVQVSNGGFPDGQPTGPPTGALDAVYGAQSSPPDILQLWVDGTLTDWDASTAQVQISTQPDPPADLVVIAIDPECNIGGAMVVWSNPIVDADCGGLAAIQIERSDDGGTTWFPIAYVTDPDVETFDDWEMQPNTATAYRARAFRGDGVPSNYSNEDSVTVERTACGLALTSNESPDLNVFLPDVQSPRTYDFVRERDVFTPLNRDFFIVFAAIENRGASFSTRVFIRAGESVDGVPCVADDCNDYDLEGVDVFQPVLDMVRADLSYVCVTNEHGNRWFAATDFEQGVWEAEVDEFEGTLTVQPVTDVPSQPDATAGS